MSNPKDLTGVLEATPERIAQVLSVFKSANCQDEIGNKYQSVGVDEIIISALTRLSELEPIIQELVEARELATKGEWHKVGLPWNPHSPYIIAGHHDPHVGKAIIDTMEADGYTGEDDADLDRQEAQDAYERETNCDFIALAANRIAKIGGVG